jgi:succinate dehydrogenase assembly factor 1
MRPLSGLQKEVLSLYRALLRATRNPSGSAGGPTPLRLHVQSQFRATQFDVKRSDVERIEYLVSKGRKQLNTLRMAGVKQVSFTTVGGGNKQ